jgi:cysteine desulfurase
MKRIYLDNAATTKIDEKVMLEMNKAQDFFGNPSSVHSFGSESANLVLKSRDTIADFLNCKAEEIIFTSGGSEADNLAIRGVIEAQGSKLKAEGKKPHAITTAIEHHAVLHTVQELEKEGKIEATYIKPDENGIIDPEAVLKAIRDNTVLVSVMYVNNETGVIQPIAEINEKLKAESLKRKLKIYFHSDAVQATEYCPMNIEELSVDLLSISAHKIQGPKGIGFLYVKKGTPIKPMITGGSQEFRLRAGTENTPAIVGLAAAINQLKAQSEKFKAIESLRDKLEQFIMASIPDVRINGSKAKRTPHISNISFLNAEGEAIILNLDFEGIAVSSGSACTSRTLESSHVLTAMGVEPKWSHGAIRFSLSRETTEEEIDKVCEVLPEIIKKLREMSPFN